MPHYFFKIAELSCYMLCVSLQYSENLTILTSRIWKWSKLIAEIDLANPEVIDRKFIYPHNSVIFKLS